MRAAGEAKVPLIQVPYDSGYRSVRMGCGPEHLVRRVYVYLDVLDPERIAPANEEFAPPGGLKAEEVEEAIRMLRERFVLAAAGISSYDPAYDGDGKVLSVGIKLAKTLTG